MKVLGYIQAKGWSNGTLLTLTHFHGGMQWCLVGLDIDADAQLLAQKDVTLPDRERLVEI